MARRRKLSPKRSKKMFSKTAARVHGKNSYAPMRGGIRL